MSLRQQHKEQERLVKQYQLYLLALGHNGNVYALSVLLIAQLIFLNLHYIIGASVSCICCFSLAFQALINLVEQHALLNGLRQRLEKLLLGHFIVNHLIMLSFVPFLVWTIVVMFQRVVA